MNTVTDTHNRHTLTSVPLTHRLTQTQQLVIETHTSTQAETDRHIQTEDTDPGINRFTRQPSGR